MPQSASIPLGKTFVVPKYRLDERAKNLPELVASRDWSDYFSDLQDTVDTVAKRAAEHVRSTGLAVAIATTPLNIADDVEGLYRVSYQVRVSQPATTSSSFQVTITWTQDGVVQTETGTLQNGNLTTTREGRSLVIRADAATPISYAVAYASVGATAMQYEVDIHAELLVDSQ